jgi:thiol-disulfide isomerase/thioredoxin
MSLKKDLRTLLKPYYWINILLSLSYIAAKRFTPICQLIFPEKTECELDMRESEILFFLLIVVVIRTRKTGSVTMINYLSSSFIYTKVANLILWFYADIRLGIAFAALFILLSMMIPEPAYMGPENVTYFRDGGLDEELNRDKHVVWLICFYTVWNPSCVNFAPIFAQLSSEYALDNFRFGKVDVGRFPEVGKKHRVSDAALSRQLPTVILFKEGKEIIRRPDIDSSNKLRPFFFKDDNVKTAFDLNNIYSECVKNPLKPSKKSKTKSEHPKSE